MNNEWYRNCIIYEVTPISFKDSNGDGLGDIKGLTEKLDYLSWLGVGAIWLTPIYLSPMVDFGYDIEDYRRIDPRYGTEEDFDTFIEQAEKKGIQIIMDLVTNHTSEQHQWFIDSRSSKFNPKRDWYIWKKPKENISVFALGEPTPPNNWVSVPGDSAWTFDHKTGEFYFHQFLKEQPDLNWRNPRVKEEMRTIIEYWIARGVRGFRVDALSHFIEDARFLDEPEQAMGHTNHENYSHLEHIYSKDQPELKEIVTFFSGIANKFNNVFIMSELYAPAEGMADFYHNTPFINHAPFNFEFINTPWDINVFREKINKFESLIEDKYIKLYAFGNHDQARIASRIGADKLRAMATIFFTLPGSVCMYYGEELGMSNFKIPVDKMRDNFAITHMSDPSVMNRDEVRTPMQWDSEKNAGFTPNDNPWLPVNPEYTVNNVEKQISDPNSLLNFYKKLIDLKKSSPALINGRFVAGPQNDSVLIYERVAEEEKAKVYINFINEKVEIDGLVLEPYEGKIVLTKN